MDEATRDAVKAVRIEQQAMYDLLNGRQINESNVARKMYEKLITSVEVFGYVWTRYFVDKTVERN